MVWIKIYNISSFVNLTRDGNTVPYPLSIRGTGVSSIPSASCEDIIFCPIVLFSYRLNKLNSKYTVSSESLLLDFRVPFDNIQVTSYLSVHAYTNLFPILDYYYLTTLFVSFRKDMSKGTRQTHRKEGDSIPVVGRPYF